MSETQLQWLFVLGCVLIFTGFVCSRALVSIAMVFLLATSLLQSGISESLKKYFHHKELWILSFFFLIVFVSGIYSEDKEGWLNWVRIKLPYLALPIAFASVKKLDERKFVSILYGFITVIFVSALFVLGNYFLNYNTITESFLRGNGIPMPYSHIRYTLMVAFAFFCSYYLFEKKKYFRYESEKWIQLIFMLFIFIALHILSVRSSLVALYAGLFILLVRYIITQRRILRGTILLLLLFLIPYLAIQFVPSLHNKWEFMRYDIQQFSKGEFSNLSDGARFLSTEGAIETTKKNWLFGVGAGDIKNEMEKFYQEKYPELPITDRKLPHNQFAWVLATTGVFGFSLFLIAFLFPLFYNSNYKHWLFVILHLILFSSFFTEATLEEQMGTGFYLIFLLLLMNHFKKE